MDLLLDGISFNFCLASLSKHFSIFLLVSFSSIGESLKLNAECVFVDEVDLMDFASALLVMVLYECIATMKFTVLFNHFSRCI